jgi:alpha-L-rhamnosidase
MSYRRITFFILMCLSVAGVSAQKGKWKDGILIDEFIYTEAPFPEAHASTIAETPDGLIAAWFGGTKGRK